MRGRLIAALIFALCAEANAQQQATTNQASPDYSVPNTPSDAILGLSTATILRPQTPKALVTDLKSGLSEGGNLKPGFGVSFVPYLLLFGDSDATLDRYRNWVRDEQGRLTTDATGAPIVGNSAYVRHLSNLQISFSTSRGAGVDDTAGRYGVGVRYVYDQNDPRLNPLLGRCFDMLSDTFVVPSGEEGNEQLLREQAEALREGVRGCRSKFSKRPHLWALESAFAASSTETNAAFRGLDRQSLGAFFSASYGFSLYSDIIFHARYIKDDLVQAKDKTFFNQDTGFFGARWRYQSYKDEKANDELFLNAEASYVLTQPDGRPSDRYFQFLAGIEYKIADGIWLDVSAMAKAGAENEKESGIALAKIKWNFSDKFLGR